MFEIIALFLTAFALVAGRLILALRPVLVRRTLGRKTPR